MSGPENRNTNNCLGDCPEFIGAMCVRSTLFRIADETVAGKRKSSTHPEALLIAAERAHTWETIIRDVAETTACRTPAPNGDCAQQPAMRAARETTAFALSITRLTDETPAGTAPALELPHQISGSESASPSP